MSIAGRVPADDQPRRLEAASADWYVGAAESEGFPHYLAILRSNLLLIAVTVIVCVGAAAFYVTRAEKVYQASADVLVTPIPRGNTSLIGLGLPIESSDPIRDVQTVSRLIKTPAVARRVIDRLGLDVTPLELLAKVAAEPVAGSNIVSISAKANDPALAAQIANRFAAAALADRTERMYQQLDKLIPVLNSRARKLPLTDPGRPQLIERLRDLQALRAGTDPTLRLETRAEAPTSPIAPRPALSIAAAILAGLILGGGVALGSQLLDPRLRREEQLRRYRIPILARVPPNRRQTKAGPLLPDRASPVVHDAYLLLATTLSADRYGGEAKRSVLITGPGSGDGKTTTALNLAASLARAESVVLVEGDARRPTLARSYHLAPTFDVSTMIARRMPLRKGLISVSSGSRKIEVLPQKPEEAGGTVVTLAGADWLIHEAQELASWLVVDAPPIALVPDMIPLAARVDEVILVVRFGNTRLKQLDELAQLLVQQGVKPLGFVLIGGKGRATYYG